MNSITASRKHYFKSSSHYIYSNSVANKCYSIFVQDKENVEFSASLSSFISTSKLNTEVSFEIMFALFNLHFITPYIIVIHLFNFQ